MQRPSRESKSTLLIGINPANNRLIVTIGQRTELGTTLLIELDGITAHTVYFRYLLLAPASFGALSHASSSSGQPRHRVNDS